MVRLADGPRYSGMFASLFAVLLILTLVGPLPAQTTAEMAQRTAVERFLEAFARRDQTEAFRWMIADRALNQEFWTYLTQELAADRGVELRHSRFRIQSDDGEVAFGRIRLDWKTKDPKNGAPVEGAQTLDLRFVFEAGAWKLHGFRMAERHFYQSFLKAASPADRHALLDRNSDLAGGWLPYSLRGEANKLADAGKPEEADRFVELSFEAAEWMKSDFERAYCYLIRGYVRRKQLQWNVALRDNEQARQLFEKLQDDEGLAKIWRNSAHIYSTTANYDKAFKAYNLAIEHFRKIKDAPEEAAALQDLGLAQQYSGKPTDALTSYQTALELQRKLGNRRTQAILIGNIAAVQQDLQRYAEALRGYEEARRIFQEIDDFTAEGPILTNLGNLYQVVGRFAEANEALRAAVQLARKLGRKEDELIAQHNLTVYLLERNQLDEAMESGFASAKLASELKNDRFLPQIWSNLGEVGVRMEAWNAARDAYREMLDAARANRHRGMEAMATMGLAVVDLRERRQPDYRAAAARHFETAAAMAAEAGASAVLQMIRIHQGDLYRDWKNYPQAAIHLRQAVELIEQIRTQAEVGSLQTSFLRLHASVYLKLADSYLKVGDTAQAFAVSEQFKARALVDVLRSGNVRLTRSMTPEQKGREASLESRLASLSTAIDKTVLTDALEKLTEERNQVRSDLQAFRERLFLQLPDLRTRRAEFSPAAPQELLTKLLAASPKSALLSYLVLDRETLLFVLHHDKRGQPRIELYRSSVTRSQLANRVDEHWQGCSTPGGDYEAAGRWLFQRLIAPAAPALAGKEHLIVVPDTELSTLAFAALLDSGATPLAAKYAISYAPSATALLRMTEMLQRRPARGDRLPLVAFGSPVFPTRLPELPAAAGEVNAISRHFGSGAVVLTGERALESRAHELLRRARFAHFATHGMLDPSAPMFSSLVLTGDGRHDGFLQARELAEMELSADLVVMSACETALGQKVRGEGILGLTWALFAGGAAGTVASHWQVADESTGALMTAFYRELAKERERQPQSRAEALRQAQLSLLRGKKYTHPYYWAPFALLGQWRSLPASN